MIVMRRQRRPPLPSKREAVNLSIYLPHELLIRLDAWRDRHYVAPSRIAVLRKILTDFLEREEKSK